MECERKKKIDKYAEVVFYIDGTFVTHFTFKKRQAVGWRDKDRKNKNVEKVELFKLVKYE